MIDTQELLDLIADLTTARKEEQEKELAKQEIAFVAQVELALNYKGEALNQAYKPDFICHDKIILELKAAKNLAPEHRAQILNYLKATGMKLGFLVNFGSHPQAQIERFVL